MTLYLLYIYRISHIPYQHGGLINHLPHSHTRTHSRQVHLMAIQSTGNATKVCNHQTEAKTRPLLSPPASSLEAQHQRTTYGQRTITSGINRQHLALMQTRNTNIARQIFNTIFMVYIRVYIGSSRSREDLSKKPVINDLTGKK